MWRSLWWQLASLAVCGRRRKGTSATCCRRPQRAACRPADLEARRRPAAACFSRRHSGRQRQHQPALGSASGSSPCRLVRRQQGSRVGAKAASPPRCDRVGGGNALLASAPALWAAVAAFALGLATRAFTLRRRGCVRSTRGLMICSPMDVTPARLRGSNVGAKRSRVTARLSRHSVCGFGTMWAGRRRGTPGENS